MDRQLWDERYRERDEIWSGEANAQLVRHAASLAPATALDAGCGEGGDAIWLAQRGWQVTGADFSSVALERAARFAARAGVADRVIWEQHDLVDWTPAQSFDLVTSHFLQMPKERRQAIFRHLIEAVKPGGHLLIVGHDVSDLDANVRRPPDRTFYFDAGEVTAMLDPAQWRILEAGLQPRAALDRDETPATVHDVVVWAVRS